MLEVNFNTKTIYGRHIYSFFRNDYVYLVESLFISDTVHFVKIQKEIWQTNSIPAELRMGYLG